MYGISLWVLDWHYITGSGMFINVLGECPAHSNLRENVSCLFFHAFLDYSKNLPMIESNVYLERQYTWTITFTGE